MQPQSKLAVLLAVALVGVLWAVSHAGHSNADVTAVTGSAIGVSAPDVTIFGGVQPPYGPTPSVTLPASGSATPVTGSVASTNVVFGPATMFQSGPITVSTEGTPASGLVTSSSNVTAVTDSGGGTLTADSISSTCTANGTNSGSVTITNGVVATATNSSGTVTATQAVPTNPASGFTINGTLQLSASDTETFTWIFNEQTTNADGSLTVTAAHEVLHGPTAKGDIYVGQSTCGITGTPASTTSSTVAATTTVPGSTTTVPGSTTTVPGATTTTLPSTTTTTVPFRVPNVVCQALRLLGRLIPFLKPILAFVMRLLGCGAQGIKL